MMKQI